MKLRRSLLFVPGDQEKLLGKAKTLPADVIVLELEDAVALDKKEEAREIVSKALSQGGYKQEIMVRINPLDKGGIYDVEEVIAGQLGAIILPKVMEVRDVIFLERYLRHLEERCSFQKRVDLIFMVETPEGFRHLEELIKASTRLKALMLGAEDFSSILGVARDGDLLYSLKKDLILLGKSYSLQVFDSPYPEYGNLEGLAHETEKVVTMGFDGKGAIHPGQIPVINELFTPSDKEIALAKKLLEVRPLEKGGVSSFDGKMIESPMLKRARYILDRAKKCEERKKGFLPSL